MTPESETNYPLPQTGLRYTLFSDKDVFLSFSFCSCTGTRVFSLCSSDAIYLWCTATTIRSLHSACQRSVSQSKCRSNGHRYIWWWWWCTVTDHTNTCHTGSRCLGWFPDNLHLRGCRTPDTLTIAHCYQKLTQLLDCVCVCVCCFCTALNYSAPYQQSV